jgi:hypothetical protein
MQIIQKIVLAFTCFHLGACHVVNFTGDSKKSESSAPKSSETSVEEGGDSTIGPDGENASSACLAFEKRLVDLQSEFVDTKALQVCQADSDCVLSGQRVTCTKESCAHVCEISINGEFESRYLDFRKSADYKALVKEINGAGTKVCQIKAYDCLAISFYKATCEQNVCKIVNN